MKLLEGVTRRQKLNSLGRQSSKRADLLLAGMTGRYKQEAMQNVPAFQTGMRTPAQLPLMSPSSTFVAELLGNL
jgi:hypothetical protein